MEKVVEACDRDVSCRLPFEVFQACPTFNEGPGHLARGHLGVPQEELEDVASETGVWATMFSLLPL